MYGSLWLPDRAARRTMARGVLGQLLRRKLQPHTTTPVVMPWFSLKKIHEDAELVGMKALRGLAVFGAGTTGLLSIATVASTDEAEHGLECPNYPWPYEGILSSYDHSS